MAIVAPLLLAASGCGRAGHAEPTLDARTPPDAAAAPTSDERLATKALTGRTSPDFFDKAARSLLCHAAAQLWTKQAADGGWHSEQYGLLRSGQAYTPFVLYALLQVPEDICPRPAGGVDRALQFIRDHTSRAGVVGLDDPEVPEYPNYSTAYALMCLTRAGNPNDVTLIHRMRDYLAGEQFREETGFSPESPVYGGWGFGGYRPAGSSGHMDIAHTRRVLQALRAADLDAPEVFERAESFLRYVQRHPSDKRPQPDPANEPVIAGDHRSRALQLLSPFRGEVGRGVGEFGLACCVLLVDAQSTYDGGFYFSPLVLNANKGRVVPSSEGGPYFRSYATATCDGILAMWAAGVPLSDDRMADARAWLADHPRWDRPEGVPENQTEPWSESIFFYHLAVRAEVYETLGWPAGARDELVTLLASQQRADGGFVNSQSHLMKEDDPLLATTLAVTALSRAVLPSPHGIP